MVGSRRRIWKGWSWCALLLLLGGTSTVTVAEDHQEPVAWPHRHPGARVFYTSLEVPEDSQKPEFRRLLENALLWVTGTDIEPGK